MIVTLIVVGYLVDCDSSGDFQSITHNIVSRTRRSVDQRFSYPEDRPSVPQQAMNSDLKSGNTEAVNDQRIEGLEDTVDVLSELVLSLRDKVSTDRVQGCGHVVRVVFLLGDKVQYLQWCTLYSRL